MHPVVCPVVGLPVGNHNISGPVGPVLKYQNTKHNIIVDLMLWWWRSVASGTNIITIIQNNQKQTGPDRSDPSDRFLHHQNLIIFDETKTRQNNWYRSVTQKRPEYFLLRHERARASPFTGKCVHIFWKSGELDL